MSIHVALNHQTRYKYEKPVSLSPHLVRLRPAVHCRTVIEAYSLTILPETHFINWQQDPFGNFVARIVFPEKARTLAIEVDIVADLVVINPFDFFLDDDAKTFPFSYPEQLQKELVPYLEVTQDGPRIRTWLKSVDMRPRETVPFLVDLNQRLCNEIKYNIRLEPGVQTCEDTLDKALGSCRDTGWLLVQILRRLGLAARFVSGYLVQLVPDVPALDGPSGPTTDFTDLHAWAEVYIPGAGWVGLDPTSGLFAGEGHIPLACTPDPVSAAPITGVAEVCKTEFSFANTVQRLLEQPRVTRPYTDSQWSDVLALGDQVETDLEQHDVRLSMGGEPTFVSIDYPDEPEWNTTADSAEKRKLAVTLIKRLRDCFGAGGVLIYGQGKWYPGEVLPRWRMGCCWRVDGEPLWTRDDLSADPTATGEYTIADARRLMKALADKLGVPTDCMCDAYEDIAYYCWKEGSIPPDVDPLTKNLKDPLERQFLAELLERGMGTPAGLVLPVAWDFKHGRWHSAKWVIRRQHLFLIPGNSAMGLRLPLDALEDAAAAAENKQKRAPGARLEPLIRTTLCVEVREGRLHVFLPPVTKAAHFIDLIRVIQTVAADQAVKVVLEGYGPPGDPSLNALQITPDPGVIEVNIHPSTNWRDLVCTVETLYEQARLTRLGTEKFMHDGRHTGTGGGNHVTIGGPTPADSPMLRRPDLLRSFLTYWQQHPGLSYFFSGAFIGPTSQAPRVDEGRDDALYELEIALAQIPDSEEVRPMWLTDRLLRHILVDLTGNTHRAEFCIDKLYSPDTESGRQGLVEFRAFEMPPHARMSLVQMLLIRTLAVWFWKNPYKGDLVRWGTALHDRFMLPHFVWRDMEDVARDLKNNGYPFSTAWLLPFFEFRFPAFGAVTVRDITLELRAAIEPWHVLGEEVTRSGTSRYVDSSIERLQVKVQGLVDGRHILMCNGHRVPLHPTGTYGEYVHGVRYRAWQPPSCLHPTIPVHSPLVFDIVDTWNGRSLGGCTYHVTHSGGRHYEEAPVNAFEAEARRIARFWDMGHTPGTIIAAQQSARRGLFEPVTEGHAAVTLPADEPINEDYPLTLDLRRL